MTINANYPSILVNCYNHNAENPLWHPSHYYLYWTDIPTGRMFRYYLFISTARAIELPPIQPLFILTAMLGIYFISRFELKADLNFCLALIPLSTFTITNKKIMTRCTHTEEINKVTPSAQGCEECQKMGDSWVHLRMCLICGHVGCCNSSKNQHAQKHFNSTKHPIIESFESNEDWRWCYVDKIYID